jgi:hypothetical protein
MSSRCHAEEHFVLCTDGNGSFQAQFRTGVNVHIGPASNGDLSLRACAAALSWKKESRVVATASSQVDLDAFGVDFGLGVPVAAFQVKKAAQDCCMEYQIYSLTEPPRLLRSITGGDFFSAADTDLDGRIEIWTRDVRAAQGIEDLTLSDFDSPPTMVLRFIHGQLMDVGSEFRAYFDGEISRLRKQLSAHDVNDLKKGGVPSAPGRSREFRTTRAKAIEIAWCYLYSGREPEAWHALGEMWPSDDVDRIRAAILSAKSQGLSAQVAGASTKAHDGKQKNAMVFDAIGESREKMPEVVPPEPILLQRPTTQSPDQTLPQAELYLELVVDEAGKVRSVESAEKVKALDPELLKAALGWKFIPAFKFNRAVPSRMRLAVSLRQ